MKVLNCPICGSIPQLERKPLWDDSYEYYRSYSYNINCPNCNLIPKAFSTDIWETEERAKKNVVADWNNSVRLIEKYLKHRDKKKIHTDNDERVF